MAGNSLQQFNSNKPQGQSEEGVKFSQWISQENVQNMISSTLTDKKVARNFVSSICAAVATNPELQTCMKSSILSAGLLATSLGLSLSPAIGQCYIVPFNDKKKGKVATFILGWRGYVQLATRTGYYDRIHVVEIKKGEVLKADPINDEYVFAPIQDPEAREKAETVGYYAFFKYNERSGGFWKGLYWSKEKMLHHADRYSQAFHLEAVKSNEPNRARVSYADYVAGKYPKTDEWKYSSFWYKEFDEMAKKTMIRQLIGKWGLTSSDFLQAYEADSNALEISNGAITVQPVEEEEVEPITLPSPTDSSEEEAGAEEEGTIKADEDGVVVEEKPAEKKRGRKAAPQPADSASVQAAFFAKD